MKDEKLLKKIGKLLKIYGVSEEDADKFLTDLEDKKYDDQEEIEEVKENGTETEQPKEQEVEKTETKMVEEKKEQAEGETETEQPKEQEVEKTENGVDKVYLLETDVKELKKTNEALSARIGQLEDIISKLGLENKQNEVGSSPSSNTIKSGINDEFERFNRKRLGY